MSTEHTTGPAIAVIGAGLSGLAAARTLQHRGYRVTVFEKSRGAGGRAATRRIDDIGFDHGAQYFTARDTAFRRTVSTWCEHGVAGPWRGRMGQVVDGRIQPKSGQPERFVGVPGMSALGKHLAADLEIRTQVRVAPPQHQAGRWQLCSDAGDALGAFDALIVAVPAPQAQPLLAPAAPHLAARAAAVEYAPAWAVMLALGAEPALPYDGLFFEGSEIAWAARNSAKPGRHGHTWVIHADANWTRAHLEAPPEQIASRLTAALAAQTGIDPDAVITRNAHRWLYSLVDNPLDVGALWDPDLQLAVCGDWCHGARIEGAYLSGQAAGRHLLTQLARYETNSGRD